MSTILYPDDFSQYIIGEKYPLLGAREASTQFSAVLSLISQARHSINIFTRNFEPDILDKPEISQSFIDFIKVSANSRLHILLSESSYVVKHGHRLVDLSQKFPSFISICKTHNEYLTKPYSFIIIDNKALFYQPNAELLKATIMFKPGQESRNKTEEFNEIWQRSEPFSELRQLFI